MLVPVVPREADGVLANAFGCVWLGNGLEHGQRPRLRLHWLTRLASALGALIVAQALLVVAACEGYAPPTGPISGFDFSEDSTETQDSIAATDSTATSTEPTGQVLTLVIVSGDDDADYAHVSATWQIKTISTNQTLGCPAGYTTAALFNQAVDSAGRPIGTSCPPAPRKVTENS